MTDAAEAQTPQTAAAPPADETAAATGGASGRRLLVALTIGFAAVAFMFVAEPYTRHILETSLASDSYLPIFGLSMMFVLVMLLNPLLRLLGRVRARPNELPGTAHYALDRGQLAIIFGLILVASAIPYQGFYRILPYAVVRTADDTTNDRLLSESLKSIGLDDKGLFPGSLDVGEDKPAVRYFRTKLPEDPATGQPLPIPWGAWAAPLMVWGVLLMSIALLLIGMALVIVPQWLRNERLPFPLLQVEEALIEDPRGGKLLPPMLRTYGFWIAAGMAIGLHLLIGLNKWWPGDVPAIPLSWNLLGLFREPPWNGAPGHIYSGGLILSLVGITYFMPTRTSFSIWVFVLLYAGWQIVDKTYNPPWHGGRVHDQRFGALFGAALFIVYLGRHHWKQVLSSMFRPAADDAQRRDRLGAWMMTGGALSMGTWLMIMGVSAGMALVFVLAGFAVSLVITRIVAETGMPFVRVQWQYTFPLINTVPVSLVSPATMYFAGVIVLLFPLASRTNLAALGTHAFGLNGVAMPRRQIALGWTFLIVVALGIVLAGATHVAMNYRHAKSRNAISPAIPVNRWGGTMANVPNNLTKDWYRRHEYAENLRDEIARQEQREAALRERLQHREINIPTHPPDTREAVENWTQRAPDAQTRDLMTDWAALASSLQTNRRNLEEHQRTGIRQPPYSQVKHVLIGFVLVILLQFLSLRSAYWPLHPIGLLMVGSWYACQAWPSIFVGWLCKLIIVHFGGARIYTAAKPVFLGLIVGEIMAGALWGVMAGYAAVQGWPFEPVYVTPP